MKKVRVFDSAYLKRDHILEAARDTALIPEVVPSDNEKVKVGAGYAEASKRFEAYILSHGKRHTPERAFILKKIYEQKSPVDIQTLYRMVCEEEGQVSLSTIYNNLSMMIDAQLVRRLDLVNGAMAFFEKTLGVEPHGYMVCQHCGKIKTLQIANIKELLADQLPKSYHITDFNLLVNGLCKRCQTQLRKEAEQERKNADKQRKATAKAAVEARRLNKQKARGRKKKQ